MPEPIPLLGAWLNVLGEDPYDLPHVLGQVHIMHTTVFADGQLILQLAFDLEKAPNAVGRHQVIKFYAVPTIYIRLKAIIIIAGEKV